jgi:hypothetical protein
MRLAVEARLFALVTAAYWCYFAVWGVDRFYYDSQGYWDRARLFERTGHFSLVSYDDPVRGYSLPLFDFVLQRIGAEVGASSATIVELSGGLLAATLGVIVLPRLARAFFSAAELSWTRVLALNAVIFFFWRGHFNYPLSDFPALLMTAIGMVAFLRGRSLGYLVAGLAFGLATNLRPAYAPILLAAIACAAFLPRRSARWSHRGLAVVIVVVGALAVSWPQMAINHHHRGSWSPLISGARQLSLNRFTAGLLTQRTETYVGPSSQYPEPLVFYLDPIGIRVRDEEGASRIGGYREYLGIVLRHPLTMIASYALHAFNGLEVRYPTPYVSDLTRSFAVRSVLSYMLLFVALMQLTVADLRRKLGHIQWFGIALFISPILTAVTSAVEPRYFLSLHVVAYMLVCFNPAVGSLFLPLAARRRLGLLLAFVSLLVVWVLVSASVSAQTEHKIVRASSSAALR